MIGHVDPHGRALITVSVRLSDEAAMREIEAWIDTGFNGDLVLPQSQIDALTLPHSGTVKAILADGSKVVLKTYACLIEWFGAERQLEVVANDGEYPLFFVGLLLEHELHISCRTGEITIE
jgi:clan AA aspartic protease